MTILQNRLNCFRYAGSLVGPASGTFNAITFNANTRTAVEAFKADAIANGDTGIPANPIAGYGYYEASWIYTVAGGRAIETGRNGFDVVFVQALLQKLGYYAGRVDGYYGAATVAAVKAFQTAQKVTADGVIGPATYYRFGLKNPVAAPGPLTVAWPPPSNG